MIRRCHVVACGWLVLVTAAATRADLAAWAPPAQGSCAVAPASQDAPGKPARVPFVPGDVVTHDRLAELEHLLPPEVWEQRRFFFSEGMRLELGPCHRSYAPPDFFQEATRAHAGSARLLAGGGLAHAPAGLPFDPAQLDPDDPDAGQKWAWNASRRWAGAGQFGGIRLSYVDAGKPNVHIEGDYFLALLLHRADLPAPDHRLPWARSEQWVSGGRTRDPGSGWRCAFRHFRAAEDDADSSRADDLFFFSSAMQKPSRVGWDPELPILTCAYERGFYLPRGGKVGRYRWRLAGVRDVIAPINVSGSGYPEDPARSFGPWGASLVDRWDLRRALVLETGDAARPIRRYLDLETLFPLYHVDGGVILQHAGRWSEDRPGYPRPPDDSGGRPMRVVDPVATILVNPGSAEVVRIEAWDTVAVPPAGRSLRSLVSESALARER